MSALIGWGVIAFLIALAFVGVLVWALAEEGSYENPPDETRKKYR